MTRIKYGKTGEPGLDWDDQEALLVFTSVMFEEYLGVDWHLPRGFLIPRLPSRMNFLLEVRDTFQKVYGRPVEKCFEM